MIRYVAKEDMNKILSMMEQVKEDFPEFRKQGVGKRLIKRMAECFEDGEVVHVITFREGDQKGTAARYCYHSCGFVDDEELVVFDYPCQRMVLKVEQIKG